MRGLTFGGSGNGVREILCLGAHSDDIEIGCGGAVLELLTANPDARITWVVFSGDGPRELEARRSARLFLKGAKKSEVVLKGFRDGFFPDQHRHIKEFFEELKRRVSPDLILTHYRQDRHQDHRVISDLAWNTWRNHLILEYEIPKYDGDLGTPNVFVPLEEPIAAAKVEALLGSCPSQAGKPWFDESLFRALMRVRGMECRSPSGLAEAFYARKLVL